MSDLIDRQAAMDEMSKQQTYKMFAGEDTLYLDANDVGSVLASLPSAQPEHGRWIDEYGDGDWHCSRCGAIVEKHEQDWKNWYFCYHCGAKMDEV